MHSAAGKANWWPLQQSRWVCCQRVAIADRRLPGTFAEPTNLGTAADAPPWAYTRRDEGIATDFDRLRTYFPHLMERRRQQAGTLSGGEQQMLAISRALRLRPKLLLLDEPSFGLAPLVVQEIFRILRTINRDEGVSMLLVEQNAHLALELADHAYLIETGCIVMGGPAGIIARDDAARRAYLGY